VGLCISTEGAYQFSAPKRIVLNNDVQYADPAIESSKTKLNPRAEYFATGVVPKYVNVDIVAKKLSVTYEVSYNVPRETIPVFPGGCDALTTKLLGKHATFDISFSSDPLLYVSLVKGGLSEEQVTGTVAVDIPMERLTFALASKIEQFFGVSLEVLAPGFLSDEDAALTAADLPIGAETIDTSLRDLMEFCFPAEVDGVSAGATVSSVIVSSDEKYIEYIVLTPTGYSRHKFPLSGGNISFLNIPLSQTSPVMSLLLMNQDLISDQQARMVAAFDLFDEYLRGKTPVNIFEPMLPNITPIRKQLPTEILKYGDMKSDAMCSDVTKRAIDAWNSMIDGLTFTTFFAFLLAVINWIKCLMATCASYPSMRLTSMWALFGYLSLANLGGQFILCYLRNLMEFWFAVTDLAEGIVFGSCPMVESGLNQLKAIIEAYDCPNKLAQKNFLNFLSIFGFFVKLWCQNWPIMIIGCLLRLLRDFLVWLLMLFLKLLLWGCCALPNYLQINPLFMFGCKPPKCAK